MLRRCQWWMLLLIVLNVIHTRSNWLCWKAQEKLQMESCFCKAIGCSYVTSLTTYLAKNTIFIKVSDRNTRRKCLLISKITLKTSGRHHLTINFLPKVTVQNHVLDSFSWYTNLQSKVFFHFCFQVRRPEISTIVDPLCHFMRNEKSLPKYLIHENSKC